MAFKTLPPARQQIIRAFPVTNRFGWLPESDTAAVRLLAHPDGDLLVRTHLRQPGAYPGELTCTWQTLAAPIPLVSIYSDVPLTVDKSAQALGGLAAWAQRRLPIAHIATPWLWDAVVTAILRQVVRATTARFLWGRFVLQSVTANSTEALLRAAFPAPDEVLEWPREKFAQLGLKFKARPLLCAAEAFQDRTRVWPASAHDLISALREIPYIGPWTAAVAAADVTGDYSVYPVGDLAVQHWAKRSQPSFPWESSEAGFSSQWRDLTGLDISFWTICALAQGGVHQ